MNIEPIAYFRSPLTSKFGVPRQSGIVSELRGRIEFVAKYRQVEALRGLEAYDYLWLIWGFSENVNAQKHPTVRPPLLGGNQRVGVWASRSPFRPNNLGLSSVRIASIDMEYMTIEVLGGDLMDGTPIYDIKPYLPYADSHPDARGGFAQQAPEKVLSVVIPDSLRQQLPDTMQAALQDTISLDPRPHYQDAPHRIYSMPFDRWEVKFRVADGVAVIVDCVLNNVNDGNKKQPTASIRR